MPGVTSGDVARESGVSRTTVSYVLTEREGVNISEATRQRVREAAERLGYSPSPAARTLRTGRSDLVLCVLPDWPAGPVVDAMLDLLTHDLADRGLSLLTHHGRGPRPLSELLRAVTPRAVVSLTELPDADRAALRHAGIPVVGPGGGDAHDPEQFSGAQHAIGRLQAEHLAGTGHTRLGWAAPTDPRLDDFATPRLAGVRAVCAERGLPEPLVVPVATDEGPATEAVRRWRATPGLTAVAAYNDEVALAVLAGLRTEGVRVPDDVAVVGVDDIPAARLTDPPLTTVAQPTAAEARHLAATVVAGLDGAPAPAHPGHHSHVVVRGTA